MSVIGPWQPSRPKDAQYVPKDIVERRQSTHLMREPGRPETPQPLFLGCDRLLDARGGTLPMCELGVEFGAQFRDAQIGGVQQIPEVIQITRFVAGAITQREQLLDHDLFEGVDLDGRPFRQIIEAS